LNRYCLLHFKI